MSGWKLRTGVRLQYDPVRGAHVLLHPEGVLRLNNTAAAILTLCDGDRDSAGIADLLAESFEAVVVQQVQGFLTRLAQRRLVVADG
ncbi:MAG TPA: pyrroloquinoline quinone biosynthesis peptide chaperone PqqD [Pseudonocardiaceae bacterium]|jgi:coenzyme PQQ biosynthesis protein PqqD|nr:pyrroloquinoline quinone biosynthesis peptide chaperone PqqD [Pseudonocardiaceae bacterium]